MNRLLVLDGGLSAELHFSLPKDTWTGGAVTAHPASLRDAHTRYYEAGANIVETATYQLHSPTNCTEKELDEAIRIAKEARDIHLADSFVTEPSPSTSSLPLMAPKPLKELKIAASIGPYGAVCMNGSEYTGEYKISVEQLKEFHFSRLQYLDEAGVDLLAIETIPSFPETKVLCELLPSLTTPYWISFQVSDKDKLADGNSFTEAVQYVLDRCPLVSPSQLEAPWGSGLVAIGVNCCRPSLVSPSLRAIRRISESVGLICYPNSGEVWVQTPDLPEGIWTGSEEAPYLSLVEEWLEIMTESSSHSPPAIIGGCCRIGSAQIRELAKIVKTKKDAQEMKK